MAKYFEKIKVLGVNFDRAAFLEVLDKTMEFLKEKKQHYLVTPNPEIVLLAQKNQELKKVLNAADISIADGVGILVGATILKNKSNKIGVFLKLMWCMVSLFIYPSYCREVLPERITGTDLMFGICHMSMEKKYRVFLLGAGEGVAEKLGNKFKKNGVNIVRTYSGFPGKEEEEKILDLINKSQPDILFVAFGAPAQEFWISRNLKKMFTVKIAMGVGGAFDFLSGNIIRAPLFFRKIGLEWLWRLIYQPWRIKRIYNAVIKFSMEILKES